MSTLPSHLRILNKSQLESMCVDCGACCHPAVPIAKGVTAIVPDLQCKYLGRADDGKTNCTVYEQRFEKAGGWCNDLATAIAKGLFPDPCPYVKDMPGYDGPVLLESHTYNLVKPQIHRAIIAKGIPDWASEHMWKVFVGGK